MLSINDLAKVWSWAKEKWWHFPIAIIIIIISLVFAWLEIFVKTEDRGDVLIGFHSQLVSWLGIQTAWISSNLFLIMAFVFTVLTIAIMFSILFYYVNKYMDTKVTTAQTRLSEANERAEKLKSALDSMTMAYRNVARVSERTASYGMDYSAVTEGSPEHLRRMNHDSLYERAKRLASEAGIEIQEE